MPSYKEWGLEKSGKEGKSIGNIGALEPGAGHLKVVLIWSQRPWRGREELVLLVVGCLGGVHRKKTKEKIVVWNPNPGNSVFRTKKENELQSFRGTDSFLCVFSWAWAVHFSGCEMKHKICQRFSGMCLTLDTGEAEQMCIVLSTHKGAVRWRGNMVVWGSYF